MAGTFGQIEDTPADGPAIDGEPLPRRTGLDFVKALRDERKKAKIRQVTLRDALRPEFQLVATVPTDMEEIFGINSKAEEHAADPGAPSYAVISACMTLAFYTTSLQVRGQDVSQAGGSPFADPGLQEVLGVTGMRGASWRAVRELYLTDGGVYDDNAVIRLVNVLMDKTGASSKSVTVDPT